MQFVDFQRSPYARIESIQKIPGWKTDIPFPSGLAEMMSYVQPATIKHVPQEFGPPNIQFEVDGFVGEYAQMGGGSQGSGDVRVLPLEGPHEGSKVIKLVPVAQAAVLLKETIMTALISNFAYSNSEFVEKMRKRRAALVPKVFAFVLTDSFAGMVMSQFDKTLSEYLLYEVGDLSSRGLTVQVCVLLYQIVNTLRFLEQIGFGHCDFKSNNVMLKFDPDMRLNACGAPIVQAALIDFGMSHIQFGSTPLHGDSVLACPEYIPGRDTLMIVKFIIQDLAKADLSNEPDFLLEFLREILAATSDNLGLSNPERVFWRRLYDFNILRQAPRRIHYHSTNDFIKFMAKWIIESHLCEVPEEVTRNEEDNMRMYLNDETIRGWEFASVDREDMPAFGKKH